MAWHRLDQFHHHLSWYFMPDSLHAPLQLLHQIKALSVQLAFDLGPNILDRVQIRRTGLPGQKHNLVLLHPLFERLNWVR